MLGFAPLGDLPLSSIPDESAGVPTGYLSLVSGVEIGVHLVEIDGYDTGAATLRWSDRGWIGTPGDVDRASTPYFSRASTPFRFERALPVSPDRATRASLQLGDILLDNADGKLDVIQEGTTVTGHGVRIYHGRRNDPFADFQSVLTSRAVDWRPGREHLGVGLESAVADLGVAAQASVYAGTGGLAGGEDLKDRTRPLSLGQCFNVTPAAVDPANLIYQVHHRRIDGVTGVRDRGAAIYPDGSDYPDYASLVLAVVAPGYFSTCEASGLFKLGSTPAGQITADVKGETEGGYVSTTGAVAKRFLVDLMGLGYGAIVEGTFDSLPTGTVGLYLGTGDTSSAASVMDRLLGGVFGIWGAGRDGRLRAWRLFDPASAAASATLSEREILDLQPMEDGHPRWKQEVIYRINHTVQSDFAGSVSTADRQEYENEGRKVTYSDPAVQTRALSADEGTGLQTLFAEEADALTVATRIVDLFGPERRLYRVRVRAHGYTLELGQVIRLVWPRYGLAGGRNCLLVRIEEDAGLGEMVLTLWR